jgi:rod shape determining protein RodA
VLLVATLAGIGLVTVHSASSELPIDYLPRQSVWVAIGLVMLVLGIAVDYHFLLRISLPVYLLSLLALVAVLLFGHEAGGARSWVGLGGFGLQPAELGKLATALLLAHLLAAVRLPYLPLREFGIATLVVALPMVLVRLQPDLGSAAMFLPILAGTVLVAGVRPRILLTAALLVLVLGAGVWHFGMRDYQRQRITTFLAPDEDPLGTGYQIRQSKIAVGSGQLVGKGYMQGTQSHLRFLPARHTDFIFAVLAEERGFVGVLVVLALYGAYFAGAVRVALRARDRAGLLLVVALSSVLAVHVLFNTAMMIGMAPVTGIPLPFLSYGGSFTLFCFFATGVILGVDFRRYVNR